MPLEFRYQDLLIIRVDGDVLEAFTRQASSHRLPLAWLAVQVQPSIRGHLIVKISSAPDGPDLPLYELQPKARPTRGSTVEMVIKTEEEPLFRQFFTQVSELCGRPVMP